MKTSTASADRYYPVAAMSGGIFALTSVLLLIPVLMLFWGPPAIAGILIILFGYVWFWLRPSGFKITDDDLVIVWPLRKKVISRRVIRDVQAKTKTVFRDQYGMGIRIGAGGLWGGFGYLWTKKEMLEMYITSTEHLVVLEIEDGRNVLISPDDENRFVTDLRASLSL